MMRFITLILILSIQQAIGQATDFKLKEPKMSIRMPNSEWRLASSDEGNYIFKRNAITDDKGRKIAPAIMVYVEDASEFKQDVTNYSIAKRLQFQGKGMIVDKVLIHESEGYPISYKNSYLTMCSYTDNGMDHILYMIHIIDKNNMGIQIYIDMTKSVAHKYSEEFWATTRSIKETR